MKDFTYFGLTVEEIIDLYHKAKVNNKKIIKSTEEIKETSVNEIIKKKYLTRKRVQ